MRAVAEGAGLG